MPESAWLDDARNADLSARDRLDQAPARSRARNPDASRRGAGRPAADRRPRADARRRASAGPDRRRVPDRHHARPSRRAQSARLPLSLVDPRDHARQDRCDEAADQDPAAMVRQAQIDRRDPQGGDDQRGLGASRHRRPQQGDGRRRRAPGARLRRHRRGLRHRDRHGLGQRSAPRRREAAAGREGHPGPRLHLHGRDASTRSRPGSARCPATPTPMSVSRRSRRSTSPT